MPMNALKDKAFSQLETTENLCDSVLKIKYPTLTPKIIKISLNYK